MKKYFLSFTILIQALFLSLVVGIFFLVANKPTDVYANNINREAEVLSHDAPNDLGELQSASGEQLDYWAENLASFDGREFGYITPARNQYQKNTCWAFAAVGAAEASVLRNGIDESATKEKLDFDETIAAYNRHSRDGSQDPLFLTVNDKYDYGRWNQGDTGAVNAFSIMTQGYTLLPENSFHQSIDTGIIKSKLTQSKYYVKSYINISSEQNAIKRAVLQYGAVTFNYSSPTSDKFFNKDETSNHTSIIVGWNDDIKSSEFTPQQPNGDGAWIIKNSWGDKGYNKINGTYCYYLSYEQPIGGLYSVDVAMREDYQNIYYYDGDVTISRNKNAGEAQAAIFEAKLSGSTKQEQLKAVMIYTMEDDLNVNVKIYKNLKANPGNVNDKINLPSQGFPVGEVDTHFERSGMQTIDLKSPINLEQGEFFSIVVSCKNKNNKPVPVNCAVDSSASINDMTYYLQDGEWISFKNSDYYADSSTGNRTAKIRAITNTVDRETDFGKNLQYSRVEMPNRLVYYVKDKQLIPEIQVYFEGKLLEYGQDYTVEVQDIVSPGMTAIEISGIGDYSGVRTTYFEVAKAKNPPDIMSGTIEVYNDTVNLYDIPIPKDWEWIAEDRELEYGTTYFPNSLKYIGADKDFYQNPTCGFYVNKINRNPSATTDISTAEVEITGVYVYTGEQIIPSVKVTYDNKELRNGVDYILTFQNNTDAGTATAIVNGNGRYFGQTMQSFEIFPLDIASVTLKLDVISFVYDGQEKKPNVIAFNGTESLSEGVDFDVEYTNNILAGNAGVIINGKGNYTGTKTLDFAIEQAEKPTVDNTTILWNKKAAKLSEIPLPKGFVWDDAEMVISENKLTAKAIYEGDDASNYKSTELYFEIIIEKPEQANLI